MKIYTKVVWEWQGDNLVQVEEESYDYDGPVDLLKGGGGGSSAYYENLNKLYGLQADQAQYLGDMFKSQVAPRYQAYGQMADNYGTNANREKYATEATAASRGAAGAQQSALEENLASMGINPADPRYARSFAEMGVMGAANEAAAATKARNDVDNKAFAMMGDVIGMGMGTPQNATQAANSAMYAANAGWQGQNVANQQQANSVGNLFRLGSNMFDGLSFGADGGQVLRLKGGGYVQRPQHFFGGGVARGGGFLTQAPLPAPPMEMPRPTGMQSMMQGVGNAGTGGGMAKMSGMLGKGIEGAGNMLGSPNTAAFGQGVRLGKGAQPAVNAYNQAATQMVDNALGPNAAVNSGTGTAPVSWASAEGGAGYDAAANAAYMAPAEADTALASATAATGEAAELGGIGSAMGAGSALGAAIPIVGAGLAAYGIGNAMGWWADGGRVTPGANAAGGGQVDGPGGPKDDKIPAMLSDGEYVMPVGAVKFFGLDRLEKMRQKGLEYEKQLGISRAG